MHSYLRAIGFQNNMKKSDIEKLTDEIISCPDRIEVSEDSMGNEFVEMTKEIAPEVGIRVCGEYAEDGTFRTEYYYPYVEGDGITTQEQIEIEKHSEKESYAGVCDEMKLGVTLIFYLQNVAEYLSEHHRNPKMRPMSATLSALSLNGKIIMPISKNEKQIQNTKKNSQDRNYLIAAAREGDEDAIENLTLEDIDTYSMLSRRIANEDILSIVDSYFMPYGIESDQYSILGEIVDYRMENNKMTNDRICILMVDCNDLIYNVCINEKDLLGEPAIGRRFKGVIWMQGKVNY
ncbi:MAG: DUF3881 family protein [Lachnospiraceae bacterium]|nr:DUF3881 family protein [Lachnospiraceae bacterium]